MDGPRRDGDLRARVLEATNIVELIGRSVPLTRRGKDYVGLCPFHQEKSPSFHVSDAKQFFYCYGCKKAGNAIDFVIEHDRLEFKDALRQLAEAANIPMPEHGRGNQKSGELQVLRDAQSAACMFFEKLLSGPEGEAARAYLRGRGFTDESIQRFRVGIAPDGWDGLLRSAAARKFTPAQLALAGLVKPNDRGGYYDTFRNRVMFPIRDPEGRVIAFGGRVMPGSDDKAKYLNSPETPLFEKGRCAFGLELAKDKVIEARTVAIVEGYTDVMMAHQFGCSNVVSTLGTAMTSQHVGLLRRYADKIVLLFDPDVAGDTAVDRAVELFLTQDKVDIAVAGLPDGLDPDEFLLKHGAAAFNAVVTEASDALTYKWKQLSRRYQENADDLTGQQKAVSEYLTLLAEARGSGPVDSIRWGAALNRVSRLTGIPVEELHRRFKGRRAPVRSLARDVSQEARAQDAGSGAPNYKIPAPPAPVTGRDRAEAFILGFLLAEPRHWADVQKDIQPADFAEGPVRRLAQQYWDHQRDEGEPVFNEFLAVLADPDLKELAVRLVEDVLAAPEPELRLRGDVEYFMQERRRVEQRKLEAQLRRTTLEPGREDDADVLKRMWESAKIPDPRRIRWQ